MNSKKMPKLKIGELEAKIPIIQGGMSVGISLSWSYWRCWYWHA